MDSIVIFSQVLILFLILVVGFYAKKRDIINNDAKKKLSELLLRITSPFLIVSSFNFEFSRDRLYNAGIVFLFAFCSHGFSILLGILLYRKYPDKTGKVLKFITIYSNCGFMGFPVLDGLYGKTGIFYGSIYVMVFHLFLWTNGVMIFSGEKDIGTMKKALVNPGILAVLIGMFLFIFSIKLPVPVFKTLEMVGGMTTPISMLIVGSTLADIDLKSMFSGFAVYFGSAVRLVLLPLFSIITLKFFGLPEMLFIICVVLVAMPAAANTTIFAEMYDGDVQFASRTIAISTVLSIVTIPLIILLTKGIAAF